MARFGVVAMSAKPYHAGHDMLIRTAAAENDVVKLYVSTSDRKRKGELPIRGSDMELIWQRYIEPSLPDNVEVEYGGSPIRKAYEFLGAENEAGSEDTYTIYSDPEDIERNFPAASLEKYLGDLYAKGRIVLEPVQRSETVDVSGTMMRQWLTSGDMESFIVNLPAALQPHGEEIWNMLAPMAESLFRGYVRQMIR